MNKTKHPNCTKQILIKSSRKKEKFFIQKIEEEKIVLRYRIRIRNTACDRGVVERHLRRLPAHATDHMKTLN